MEKNKEDVTSEFGLIFDPDSFMDPSALSYQVCMFGNGNWKHDPGTLEAITSTPVSMTSSPVSVVTVTTLVSSSSARSSSTATPHEVKVCSFVFKFVIARFPGQVN